MEREVDSIFTGVCVAVIVCIVSGFLYYMFKHAAFVPSQSVPITRDIIGLRKKVKKSDSKKSKKAKKTKQVLELDEPAEQEVDKAQTSDENLDEDEEPLQETPDELEEDDNPIPSGEKTDEPLCKPATPMTTVSPPGDLANGDLATGKSSAKQESQSISEHNQEPNISNDNSDFADQPETPQVVSSEELTQSVPLGAVPLKSKRSKRRKNKRSTPPATPTYGLTEPISDLPSVEHVAGPLEELPQRVPTKILTSADDSQVHESREDFGKLTDQLNASQNKLAEASKRVATLSEENKRLRAKEEETALGLRVLQEQYTELLRANKSLEHEQNLKDIKLKNLESEKSSILSRLDHTNSEVGRLKNEAEIETRKLREQLAESKSKLATMAAAIASAPPPGPSPELVRAQELAQAVSSDNCLLKSRLEQMETELSQLRQAGLLQQQELQAFRVENRKLHSEKESALGELQAQRQAEQAESSSRIANYEAQLQHRNQELEAETQRNKDFAKKLSETRTELSHVAEREKRQSEIISSLEYQFAELNAEKQRLIKEVTRTKALNETCANELRVQVANMTNDLQRTTNELHDVRQRADRLAAELEVMKQSTTVPLVPPPPASVSVSVETTETLVNTEDGSMKKQSAAAEEEYRNKTDQIIEHMRTELSTKEQELKEAKEEVEGAQRRVEEATMELTHYKTTLLETEKVLESLQQSVQKTEKNWTDLLKRSELEQNKLKSELNEVHSQTAKIAGRMRELETQLDLERKESSRLRSELNEQIRKFQSQTSSSGEEKTNDLSIIGEACQPPTGPDVQITETLSEKPPVSVKTDSLKEGTTTDTDRRNLTSLTSAECNSDDGSVIQQRVESTPSLMTSPTCDIESPRSATVVEEDSCEPPLSPNPTDVQLETQLNSVSSEETIGNVVMFKPNIEQADLASGDPANLMNDSLAEGERTPECKEVEGTWLALTSVGAPSDRFVQVSTRPVSGAQWTSEMENLKGTWLALTSVGAPSDRFVQVSTRPVSGAQWTSEMENLKNSRVVTTSDGDIDDDFDAVLVDDTDTHVPDDIFDSVTKPGENILEDTHEKEKSTVRQRKSKVTKTSPAPAATELSE